MAWIESHQELGRHPKTRKLARMLDITVPAAIGHLHLLWWWALDFAEDGDIGRFDAEDIADAAQWHSDAELFVRALVDTEFVDDDDSLHLHDWHDYAGKLIERRNADRMRKRQERKANQKRLPEPVSDVSDGRPKDVERSHSRTVPYSTVPNHNQTIKDKEIYRQNEFDDTSIFDTVMALYNETCTSFPKVMKLNKTRKTAVKARYKEWQSVDTFQTLFQKAEASDFLSGRNGKWTSCNFDWLLKESNALKVLEGNYDNKGTADESAIDKALRELGP